MLAEEASRYPILSKRGNVPHGDTDGLCFMHGEYHSRRSNNSYGKIWTSKMSDRFTELIYCVDCTFMGPAKIDIAPYLAWKHPMPRLFQISKTLVQWSKKCHRPMSLFCPHPALDMPSSFWNSSSYSNPR